MGGREQPMNANCKTPRPILQNSAREGGVIASQPIEIIGDPGRARTCNPQLRRLALYPIELRDHIREEIPHSKPNLPLAASATLRESVPDGCFTACIIIRNIVL